MKKQLGRSTFSRHAEFISASLKGPETSSGRRGCFGRSMIEMLGVLAIVGVLSIGSIALYRRAVNNHHANTILDDVNRFAFAIIEKGNYPLERIIPKGDFKESGIYQLEGYQDIEANQFSITVADVPKGVCEPLLDKATIEYKVRVNPNANEKGTLYDTLNKDLCNNDTNIMVFYFGDTTDLCNPKENGYTPCTINSDCCGGEFCWYSNNSDCKEAGIGRCEKITETNFPPTTKTMSDNHVWIRSTALMNWWSAQNWCTAQGLKLATRLDIDCATIPSAGYCTKSSILKAIQEKWGNFSYHWLEDNNDSCKAYSVYLISSDIDARERSLNSYALCH